MLILKLIFPCLGPPGLVKMEHDVDVDNNEWTGMETFVLVKNLLLIARLLFN